MSVNSIDGYFDYVDNQDNIESNRELVFKRVGQLASLLINPTEEQSARWKHCLVEIVDQHDDEFVVSLIPKTPLGAMARIIPHIVEGYFVAEWAIEAVKNNRWDLIDLMVNQIIIKSTDEDQAKALLNIFDSLIKGLPNASASTRTCWKLVDKVYNRILNLDDRVEVREIALKNHLHYLSEEVVAQYFFVPPCTTLSYIDKLIDSRRARIAAVLFSMPQDLRGAGYASMLELNRILLTKVLPKLDFLTNTEKKQLNAGYEGFEGFFSKNQSHHSSLVIFPTGYAAHAAVLVLYNERGLLVDLIRNTNEVQPHVITNFCYKQTDKKKWIEAFLEHSPHRVATSVINYAQLIECCSTSPNSELARALSLVPIKTQRTGNCTTKSYLKSIFASLVLLRINGKNSDAWDGIVRKSRNEAKVIEYLLRLAWIEFLLESKCSFNDRESGITVHRIISEKMERSAQKINAISAQKEILDRHLKHYPRANWFLAEFKQHLLREDRRSARSE